MGRVALFGDVGGHADPLRAKLLDLGAVPDAPLPSASSSASSTSSASALGYAVRLPQDLTVVFVGDLVHRGPDSSSVLALVDHLVARQPEQVVVLAGNHEDQYAHHWRFGGVDKLEDRDADLVRSWWRSGTMRVAAAVRSSVGEELLVTHAGLTAGLWDWVGKPATAAQAADAVNGLIPDDPRLRRAGVMLGEVAPDYTAGPLWADALVEVVMSWVEQVGASGEPVPFSQVHGHSSVFWFPAGKYRAGFPRMLRPVVHVDTVARHTVTRLPGARIIGIDPCHGRDPAPSWEPLVLHSASLIAR